MAIEVFNRYEKKYMLDQNTYELLNERLDKYMEADAYSKDGGFYSICNIYYDTDTDQLIRKSLEKPTYKEKLRLRSYGTPDGSSQAFVEIKKKYKGIVNKRRISMPLNQAMAYLDYNVRPTAPGINNQILREIDYFKEFYKLTPKVYISYDRRAYFGREDHSFRVTFDTNIQTRREDIRLQSGAYGTSLLQPGQWLMEVKISGAAPAWFTQILSELKIYPVSFSKYGTEYKNYVQSNIRKGEKITCLNQYSQQPIPQYQPAHQCYVS